MTKRSYITLFFTITFIKVLVSLYLYYIAGNQFFGGGNDSEYYHQYALGLRDDAVNIWPVILRWLNDNIYYHRGFITFILSFLGMFIIPLMVGQLAINHQVLITNKKTFWLVALIISLYPALYYQTTDMYRDVMMLFIFLCYLFFCRKLCNQFRLLDFILILIISYILYEFRPYLGGACFITLLILPFYSYKRYPLLLSLIAYLLLLYIFYRMGFLDRIIYSYRSIFDQADGGSNLGLRFDGSQGFINIFLLSWIYQIIGLVFVNLPSVFVFFVESVPFLYFLTYVIRFRKFSTKFVDALILFFMSYSTVWLLGNDNLGSATRLRIFSYIVIVIAYFIIRNNKMNSKRMLV